STSGLLISFVEDSPPREVSRDRPISFSLKVKNTGVFTIPSGGFMARLVGLDNNFNPNELSSSNADSINQVDESGVGGEATVDLGSTSYNPEQMFDDRIIKSGDLQVEVCYPYETHVVTNNFWIGSKTSEVSKGSITQGDNSNAPVHVREFEATGGGTYTDFSFKIKVVGKGSVVASCFPSTQDEKMRNVDLDILERDVSCYYEEAGEKKDIGNSGTVVLNNLNEKLIHCKIPFSGEKPIKSQLQMTLKYMYLDKISVPAITIRRV
ncbi:MAG: hypothetical protein QW404_01805, partial [Candidatus Nanoarchaeia archaeon]